jgi:hypothetical protein
MPRKTTILILILAAVTGLLLFLAVTEGRKPQPPKQETAVPVKEPVQKTARVFFSPQNIDLSSGAATPASTVDLLIDTGGQEIVGVQIEIQYDPQSLSNLRLTPALDQVSFFGPSAVVLFNEANPATGRISYAVAISPNEQAKTGIGKVAAVSFSKAFNAQGTTSIRFLDKTIVTILGENESILKESLPLNVTLSARLTPPPLPPASVQ